MRLKATNNDLMCGFFRSNLSHNNYFIIIRAIFDLPLNELKFECVGIF